MHVRALGRPSPAMLVASIALFVSLGGGAYAALNLPKNSVGTAQIKDGAVTAAKLHDNSVTSIKVKDHSLLTRDFKTGQLLDATVPAATVFCGGGVTACSSVDNDALTPLSFGNTQFDTAKLHTYPDRLTAPAAGIYQVEGSVVFPPNSTGVRQVAIGTYLNCCLGMEQLGSGSVSGSDATALTTSALVQLRAGESVALQVIQTSGAAMTPTAAWFSMSEVGP